jgi:hypothetical protein
MHFPAPLLAAATLFGLLGRTLACVQYGVSIEEIGYYANGNIVDNGDEVCTLNAKAVHSPALSFHSLTTPAQQATVTKLDGVSFVSHKRLPYTNPPSDFDCHDGFSARINDITADDVTYNTPWGSVGFGADCTYYCIDDGGVDECTIVCLASNYGC